MLPALPEQSDFTAPMIRFRQMPMRHVRVDELVELGPAGTQCEVIGMVGATEVRMMVLLCRASSGSFYLAEPRDPPWIWFGRVFAAKA